MTFREFVVPTDEEIFDALGVEPVGEEGGAPNTRVLRLEAGRNEHIVLSYDPIGRSVRVRWSRGGVQVLDLFREGATLLTTTLGPERTGVLVEFETDSLAGRLTVVSRPALSVNDHMLFR